MKRYGIIFLCLVLGFLPLKVLGQGNKLNISATPAKNMSVCGFDDTTRIAVYNISSSVISNVKITLILPAGVTYIAGTFTGTGISESNISNLNKPVFSGPNLLIGQNFNFRVKVKADCDIVPLLSGSSTPQIDVRVDYTGNFDLGSSIPFVPIIPSPGFASITNSSFIGNVGDKFTRKVTITNYGKGPLRALRLMRINGKDVVGNSQTGFGSVKKGDTIFTNFTTTDFKNVGDKDTLLEQNESITITDTFTILGCKKTNTYYEIGWGCGGKLCQIIKDNASVTISSDNPNLVTWPGSTDKYCFDGTTLNAQYLTITNIGKKAAKDIVVNIFVGTGASNTLIDTTSFYANIGYKGVKKLLVMDTAYKYVYTSACVPTNALNFVRIKLKDLSPKDTLYLTWNMTRCAETSCSYGFYDLSWIYNYNYKNQCDDAIKVGDAWGKVYTLSSAGISTLVPTDLARDETKDFKFTFNSFYNLPLSSNGRIRIDLVLPITLQHSLSKSDFFIVDGSLANTWTPDSIAMRGDTLRAYMGKAFKFGLTNAELTVRLKGICSKSSGNFLLPVSMTLLYNTDPTCTPFTWIRPVCNYFNVKVHCSNSCSQGMIFKNFEASRISYGLPDNNNDGIPDKTGSLDHAKIRKERLMFGDTFETVFIGRPKTSTTNRNWRYGYAESFITYGSYVDVVDARLVVLKGSTLQTGTCNTVRVKKVLSGAHATFKFDFSVDSIYPKGCLSSTYRFSNNDSIRLIVRYRVTKNLIYASTTINFTNRFYFGSAANPAPSQSFQCDTFGSNLVINGYYYANCCSDNIVYSNCAEATLSQSWYYGLGPCCQNYAGNNLFPYEYRNFTKLKALKIYLPSGFKLAKTYFGQYRTTGVGTYKLERKDTVPIVKGTTNPIVFDFRKYYTDSGGTINPGDDGVQGYFTYTVQPRCNLPANTPIRIDYDYIFERGGVMGKGYDTVSTKNGGSYDLFTFNPPTLSLGPAIPTVYATSDTVDWEVRYTNPSGTFSAYNVWLSPKKGTNIKVTEIRDMDKDTLIKPTGDIYRAGILAAGKMRRFKVRAVFSSCNPDSLILFGSYNCAEYPADFASYPCTPNKAVLYLEPQNTRLQMTLTDSASILDLCAENKLSLLLENIQSVTAYNTKVRISLPIGMKVVSGSTKLKYPLNSSAVSIGVPKLISGTTYEWDLPALSSTVAAGFKGTKDTSKNKLLITFRVSTDCDYASGSFVSARGVANLKCGNAIPSIPGFSNPLDIKGVTRPYYTLVKSWADTMLPCQKPMYIKNRVIFLGPGNSGSKDKVEVFLPNGVKYDTSFWNAVRNAPSKDSLTITSINGAQLLSWLMPKGIVPGDSMEFDIRAYGETENLTCGPADIITRSVVVQPVVCISTGNPCDIKVITGSELATPMVDKGSLQLVSPTITTKLISSDSEQVHLTITIKNTGRLITKNSPIIVRFHYDKNATGIWETTDPFLASDTFSTTLNPNQTFTFSKTINVLAGQSCGILAVTDSAACACLFGQKLFPAPELQNAGRDTAICSLSPLKLGLYQVKTFKYVWADDQVIDSANIANPKFTAANQTGSPETRTLILTTNRGLCISKDTVAITTYPLPSIFTLTKDTEICEKRSVLLNTQTQFGNGGFTYLWSPTNGLANSIASKTLAKPDSTTVYTITVTDAKGCFAKDTARIRVNPFPRAWFTWPVSCQGRDPEITDSSFISAGSIALRVWKIPGYDTFGVTKINIPFGNFSSIPVTLITESAIGCADTVKRVVDVKTLPKVGFSSKYVCLGDSTIFNNYSSIDSGKIVAWKWDFGDGKNSNSQNQKHRYVAHQKYEVKLVAISEHQCTDTFTDTATVYPKPSAGFTAGKTCERDSLRFTNQSNLFGDTLQNYTWIFSNNAQSLVQNPAQFADTFGYYRSTLIVNSIHGCADTIVKNIEVFAVPKAKFGNLDNCLKINTQFSDSSTISSGSINNFIWDFNDGNKSTNKSPFYTYLKPGSYTPKLLVTSNQGCKDSINGTVNIWPLAHPNFTAISHCFNETFSANSNYWGGGNVTNYLWKLGNGDTAITANVNYLYKTTGIFQLYLKVTTDKGCTQDTQANIEVHPLPTITAAAINPCNDDSAVFTGTANISKGTVANSNWKISNGLTSSSRIYRTVLSPAGNYTATFTAISANNCIDSATTSVVIQPAVLVDFDGTNVCLDELTTFTDKSVSTEPVTAYNWRFGDGQGASSQNTTHVYQNSGNHNVDFTITTKSGCDYTQTKTIVVHPKPYPGFALDPRLGTIVNPNITITDMSNGADTLRYQLSDGFVTNQRNFVHTFPDSGYFRIKQIASTQYGCVDSTSDSIFINFMYTLHVPQVFTPNDDTKNEFFGPGGMGIQWYNLKVYNRWGEVVYESDNSQPWDGKIAGEYAPDGVYAVLMSIRDYKGKRHYYRGSVTIMR
ncbi:MAG: PKD domain-containing protein [Bacteroidia bacterium]|nr:PKD domain-containing protein [Bacteroidia bacterium]